MAVLLAPARVIPCLQARGIPHIIRAMARVAAVEAFLDHDRIEQAIEARGDFSSFCFGRGVAIPHAAIPGLRRPLGVFARLEPAQDFGATDHIPVDLVFLLLSPEGDGSTHLRALACVARRLRDHEVATRLRSARDAEAIHIVLTSDAWRELDGEPEAGCSATPSLDGLTNRAMYTSIDAPC